MGNINIFPILYIYIYIYVCVCDNIAVTKHLIYFKFSKCMYMTINLIWVKYKNETVLQVIYLQFVCVCVIISNLTWEIYEIISNLTWEIYENETILHFIIKR